MTGNIEPWVTMKDVQEHLGARCETIARWVGKRNMSAYKVGRQLKFKLSDIDEWVRSGGAADDEHLTGRGERNLHA